jgi:hypothetical protein
MNTLNGLPIISARLSIPWRGVWSAEVELDIPDPLVAQQLAVSGLPAVLMIDTTPFNGVIDATGSGTFSAKTTLRIVGGRGGWGKTLDKQDFTGPGGSLVSTLVYAATGLAVGEVVTDVTPEPFGEKFSRAKGPARQVFGEKDWFVEPTTSITFVSGWPPNATDGQILDFHAFELRATIAADGVIYPGTVLVDERFNGEAYTVRDVEQTFDANGSVAECWCSDSPTSRFADALASMVKAFAGVRYLRTYRYRVVVSAIGKAELQAISDDAPDLNPLDQFTGLSGAAETLAPATEVVVGFAEGDPRYPRLLARGGAPIPLILNLSAATSIALTAPAIAFVGAATFGIPGTAVPLTLGPWATAIQAALATFAASAAAATTAAQIATAAGILSTALGALPPSQTLVMKGN